jgi:hypothetical protein
MFVLTQVLSSRCLWLVAAAGVGYQRFRQPHDYFLADKRVPDLHPAILDKLDFRGLGERHQYPNHNERHISSDGSGIRAGGFPSFDFVTSPYRTKMLFIPR